jgi:transcription termination/antitermination protein NusA
MDIKWTIDQISQEKGIKRDFVLQALLSAIAAVENKKFPFAKIEARFNETGDIEVYNFKKVVDSEPEMLDEDTEINLPDALKIGPELKIGDEVGIQLEFSFGRIDAAITKNVMNDAIERAAHAEAYKKLAPLKGKVVQGTVLMADLKGVMVNLGSIDGYMTKQDQTPGEKLKRGQVLDFYVLDVRMTKNGRCKVMLSRKDSRLVVELLKEEVMEVKEGSITVVKCVREPGVRTKLVVDTQESYNPVSVCIGTSGYRIEKVQSRLSGERVDIIQNSRNEQNLLTNLFNRIRLLNVQSSEKTIVVEVLKEDLPKVLGYRGVNVRLASQLLGKELKVKEKV